MFETRDEAILIAISIVTLIGAYIFYGISISNTAGF